MLICETENLPKQQRIAKRLKSLAPPLRKHKMQATHLIYSHLYQHDPSDSVLEMNTGF